MMSNEAKVQAAIAEQQGYNRGREDERGAVATWLAAQARAMDAKRDDSQPWAFYAVAARTFADKVSAGEHAPAPAGTRPQGGDGETGSMRSTSDAVTAKPAGAQGNSA